MSPKLTTELIYNAIYMSFVTHAGNEEGLFDIIEETGLLYTTATLDRETRSNYLLSIQARDSATVNRLSSVIQVHQITGCYFTQRFDNINNNMTTAKCDYSR